MNDSKEPETRKLKSAEPDLKISIGSGDNHLIQYRHSIIMAHYSKYIDTMLASPMVESKTLEISFPDITPEIWGKMMTFLENPVETRRFTVQDAMLVAPFYDKYDFADGCVLCNHVFEEFIKNQGKTPDLNTLVDMLLLVDELSQNMEPAKKVGIEDLSLRFKQSETRIMFTQDQVKKLVPLIAKEKDLLDKATPEEVLSPLFPRYIVQAWSSWEANRLIETAIPQISLSGTGCKADGLFKRDIIPCSEWICNRTGRWDGEEIQFSIVLNNDWEIVGENFPEMDEDGEENFASVVEKVLWTCPNSGNKALPPRGGWKPVDEFARGKNLTIDYIYPENEEN